MRENPADWSPQERAERVRQLFADESDTGLVEIIKVGVIAVEELTRRRSGPDSDIIASAEAQILQDKIRRVVRSTVGWWGSPRPPATAE